MQTIGIRAGVVLVASLAWGGIAGGVSAQLDMDGEPSLGPLSPLLLGPVEGFTSGWHDAPEATWVPMGTLLQFRQLAPPQAVITWTGAREIARDAAGSTAICILTEMGTAWVDVDVVVPGQGLLPAFHMTDGCELECVPLTPTDVQVGAIAVAAAPLGLPDEPTNAETMAVYFGSESIAGLTVVGEDWYRTSVERSLTLSCEVHPQGFEPLLEWRVNGEAAGLGGHVELSFHEVGAWLIAAGPFAVERVVQQDIYRVAEIVQSPDGVIVDGFPTRYAALTDPPGLERELTWLASTKVGSASPTTGTGPTFVTTFQDSWGPTSQWAGVRCGDLALGLDSGIGSLIADFLGPDTGLADAAYAVLAGLEKPAIQALIGALGTPGTWSGLGFDDERSSMVRMEPAPKDLACLYLIDAILDESLTPYYAPMLTSEIFTEEHVLLAEAVPAYQTWWSLNQGLPFHQLQTVPHPLDATNVAWLALLPQQQGGDGTGTEENNTKTPPKKYPGMDANCIEADANKSYKWKVEPATEGGLAPYNCLAWALTRSTTHWYQLAQQGTKWEKALEDHGYSSTAVDCAGTCPKGKGPKVMMAFHGKAPVKCENGTWAHALNQQADGKWSSKNGEGSRYKDITDTDKFLDKYYPKGGGQDRSKKCFCKP